MPTTVNDLEKWLGEGKPRTIDDIAHAFPEKGAAAIAMILMVLPATPLPTGFVTHIFEIITMIVSVQIVLGFRTLWLPARLRSRVINAEALAKVTRTINKFNTVNKRFPRLQISMIGVWLNRIVGLFMLVFTVAAFLSPPFSGLDTLPSLGVVLLALGLVLDSVVFLIIGVLVGSIGVGLGIILGRLIFKSLL